jgi:integrase
MPRPKPFPDYPAITKQYEDRHGKHHYYVGKIAIKARPFRSPEFRAEYERVVHSPAADPVPRLGAIPGSLRWICQQFMAATFEPDPKTDTQHQRRLRVESTCAEPWKPGDTRTFGDFPANRIEPKHILVLMLRKKNYPHAANQRLEDLKRVFRWAKKNRLMSDNPAADMDKLKVPKTDGFYTWTDADREAYCAKHPPGTPARDAYDLSWWSGQRSSDTRRFNTSWVKDGSLCFTQKKTGKYLELWIPPEIQAIMARTTEGLFLLNARGKPYNHDTFKKRWRVWCGQAGLPNCTSHGIRKAAASWWASQPNVTAIDLMDHFGFSLRIAETYIKKRNQKENNRRMQMRVRGIAA